MPLITKNAPANSFESFAQNIHEAANSNSIKPKIQEDQEDHAPHRLFHLELNDILAGKGTRAAQMKGWRYLFEDENGGFHAAHIEANETEEDHSFHSIDSSDQIKHFIEGYEALHEHELIQDYHYEISILVIPDLLSAIWLVGDRHHHEIIIPIPPAGLHLEANRPYSSHEFLDVVEHGILNVNFDEQTETEESTSTPEPAAADTRLEKLSGINAEIMAILKNAGINNLDDLLGTDPNAILAAIQEVGIELHEANPLTWHDQAAMINDEAFEDLLRYQLEIRTSYEDLTIVEGINDQVAAALKSNGIELLSMLIGILTDEIFELAQSVDQNLTYELVDTWSMQAELAMSHQFDELIDLQKQIRDQG
jgi:predicted flap endonuclease-1-like 5' DNA nuclease